MKKSTQSLRETAKCGMVEYALSDIRKPVGVASYQFTTSLPDALREQLPTIADLEALVKDVEEPTDHP